MAYRLLKSALIVFCFSATSSKLYAQSGFSWFLQVNPTWNFAKVTIRSSDNFQFKKSTMGWQFGLSGSYGLTSTISLGLFTSYGSQNLIIMDDVISNEFPFWEQWNCRFGSTMHVNMLGNNQLEWIVGAAYSKLSITGVGTRTRTGTGVAISKKFNSLPTRFELTTGVSYRLDFREKHHVKIGLQFSYPLGKVPTYQFTAQDPNSTSYKEKDYFYDVHQNTLSLNISYGLFTRKPYEPKVRGSLLQRCSE